MAKNIENLIPHRAPFLFVDEVLSYTKEEIIGIKTFTEKDHWLQGSFPELDIIPGTILIEAMAQCGGAGVKLLGVTDGIFGLVSIENAEFYNGAKFGDQVKFVIENIRLSEKIIKQQGTAYIDDKVIMKAGWMCVKIA
ncbi:3-hydroxyacyl-ACP dehydratase FabZ family protein [Flavobacterium johnsoniae]|jgi:3-hydroxyacyl-[acyl-carrier-protein] dehydratase|uniref:Beta-hydroxyacyl-ACP dehydratase n=1 Tax=Flavobacterium johnsoniae TaxID=986 RepID=A0A1J7CJ58_FLAJO|nr:3-hydroxyacyl-ACP dehydratase FabZ family protein [Flavobacterium johnsoniae]OIV39674.1 beta-hydroxyacyl-ACP dehydratase [Flavobacterium johnsoniae]